MPWTPSTFTPSKSPSSCPLYLLSWSGTSRSWYSQGCPSPTLSMVWPQIFKSSSSNRWACAGKSRHTWPGWRPATEKGPTKANQSPLRPDDWKADWEQKDTDRVTEFYSNVHYEWTGYFFTDLESNGNMHTRLGGKKCQSCLFVAIQCFADSPVNGIKVCRLWKSVNVKLIWCPEVTEVYQSVIGQHRDLGFPDYSMSSIFDWFSSWFDCRQESEEGMLLPFTVWSTTCEQWHNYYKCIHCSRLKQTQQKQRQNLIKMSSTKC